jgi:hypothetical protein
MRRYHMDMGLTKLVCLAGVGLMLGSELEAVSYQGQPHLVEERADPMVIREGPQPTSTVAPRLADLISFGAGRPHFVSK